MYVYIANLIADGDTVLLNIPLWSDNKPVIGAGLKYIHIYIYIYIYIYV